LKALKMQPSKAASQNIISTVLKDHLNEKADIEIDDIGDDGNTYLQKL
jgi:hypothetical protein